MRPSPLPPPPPPGQGMEGLRPSQVVVVPSQEWERIRGSLHDTTREAERTRAELDATKARHERSKVIVSNWENTIEGQRLKKLQARKLREEEEEVRGGGGSQ